MRLGLSLFCLSRDYQRFRVGKSTDKRRGKIRLNPKEKEKDSLGERKSHT